MMLVARLPILRVFTSKKKSHYLLKWLKGKRYDIQYIII